MSPSYNISATRIALGAAVLLAACGGAASNLLTAPPVTTSIVGVSPAGGATNIAVDTVITMRFDHAMMSSMEQYVTLHRDSLRGPMVAGSFAWSADRTQLMFTPGTPLASHTMYVLHVGGGMTDGAGSPIDYGQCPAFGGQSVTTSMMGGGGMRGGGSGEMGPGWQGANGTYGMAFVFTTA